MHVEIMLCRYGNRHFRLRKSQLNHAPTLTSNFSYAFTEVNGDDEAFYIWNYKAKPAYGTSDTTAKAVPQYRSLHLHSYQRFISRLFSSAGVANATETCAGKIANQMTTAHRYNLQALTMLRAVIRHYYIRTIIAIESTASGI
jgi:hypothetical protein